MIINKIKQLISGFLRSNKKSSSNLESNLPESNFILIRLDPVNKEPYIKLNISDISDNACKQYAEALYNLNVGRYYQSFIDLLLEISQHDAHINKFVQSLIIEWGYLIKANTFSNNEIDTKDIQDYEPIISPMDFNKHAK